MIEKIRGFWRRISIPKLIIVGLALLTLKTLTFSERKAFYVNAKTKKGIEYINRNAVYFIADTLEAWGTLIYHKNGVVAKNVKFDKAGFLARLGGKEGTYHYNQVPEETVNRLGLFPNFTEWQKNGKFVVIPIGLASIIILCYLDERNRKRRRQEEKEIEEMMKLREEYSVPIRDKKEGR